MNYLRGIWLLSAFPAAIPSLDIPCFSLVFLCFPTINYNFPIPTVYVVTVMEHEALLRSLQKRRGQHITGRTGSAPSMYATSLDSPNHRLKVIRKKMSALVLYRPSFSLSLLLQQYSRTELTLHC